MAAYRPTLGVVRPLPLLALDIWFVFNGVALLEVVLALVLHASALRRVLLGVTLVISPLALEILVALIPGVAIGS